MVVFKEKVYIGGGIASSDRETQTVMIYNPKLDFYDTLPPYTYKYFAMAVVDNQLVLIGGRNVQTNKKTNKLGVWNEQSKRWTYPLPQMTTACHSALVATHNNRWLVVMGGCDDGSVFSRVEILDTTESKQWYHAASLPQPCAQALPVTIGNMCYLLGGFNNSASVPPTPSPWESLPDTPLPGSTALAFNQRRLCTRHDDDSYGHVRYIYI